MCLLLVFTTINCTQGVVVYKRDLGKVDLCYISPLEAMPIVYVCLLNVL